MKKFFLCICIIVLSFWSVSPMFQSGFFPFHDNSQVSRVYEMTRGIKDGMFPVRWSEDFGYGYGYPVFTFYAPFSYYVGAYIQLLSNIDPLEATKLLIVFGTILAGITMFLLAREFWGNSGGIVSSLLYVYAPYHAVDIYVRGDVAEFWAYAFIPLAFYGLWKAYATEKRRYIVIGAIGFAGIILSHNLTALMTTPFLFAQLCILFVLDHKKYPRKIIVGLKTLFLGLLLSAWYWLPVMFEIPYTNVLSQTTGGFDFHKNFICLSQFWYSPWGYGGSAPGCVDGLSFMLGKIHIFVTALSILIAVLMYKEERAKLVLVSSIFLLFSLLLTLQISQPVWNIIAPMSLFQFPWRFLVMVMFTMSFISGFIVWTLRHTIFSNRPIAIYIGVVLLLIAIVFLNHKFFKPKTVYQESFQTFTDREYIAWNLSNDAHEYLPKGFAIPQHQADLPQTVFEAKSNTARISYESIKTNQKTAIVHTASRVIFHANIAYFPGWKATVDNSNVPITQVSNGMNITVPRGDHDVSFTYHQTPIELIASAVSVIGFFILLIGIIIPRRSLL